MEIITTHINADFDALASMIAAKRLYPDGRLVFPGSQEKNVRDYLLKCNLGIKHEKFKKIPLSAITKLIIVDTRRASRLGGFSEILKNPDFEIHIYDHHPYRDNDIRGNHEQILELGATTTIMVENLRERGIEVNPEEATVFALGIYEETGFFTFTTTTQRDLNAAAYLVSKGANLTIISDYIRRDLTKEQLSLLNELVESQERFSIEGIEIVIATASAEGYVGDLAVLAHRLRDMENINVLFTLIHMDSRILMVARSRIPSVDVGAIAALFGGGGHPTAASATIKDKTMVEVKEGILEVLKTKISPVKVAKEIMTFPVKSIQMDTTLGEASKIMNKYMINTLLVLSKDSLVGTINRQTVDRAIFHRLEAQPVKEYMSSDRVSISPDTPLEEIQTVMVENNLHIVPVLDEGKIIGVVSRTDLLKVLHEDLIMKPRITEGKIDEISYVFRRNINSIIQERLPQKIIKLLKDIGEAGDEMEYSVYVVGGFVRDLLLSVENFDVDIVVEGDGVLFAQHLAKVLKGRAKCHLKFGTGVVVTSDEFKIDVATARTEYYEHPGALPTVELGSIKQDLYRRDFTINTLAIKLNKAEFALLIDFFGGQRDLKAKTIRVLHNLSFIEDPTRLFRAVRFEQRYNFKVGKHTQNLMRSACKMNLFERLGGRRVFTELSLIFSEENPFGIIKRLAEIQALKFLHPNIKIGEDEKRIFEEAEKVLAWFKLLFLNISVDRTVIYFLSLTDMLADHHFVELLKYLELPPAFSDKLRDTRNSARRILSEFQFNPLLKHSEIYNLLKDAEIEALLYAMIKTQKEAARQAISIYLTKLRNIKGYLKGEDLKKMGFTPGPDFKKIFDSVLIARLDGLVETPEDEISFVKEFLKNRNGRR